MELGKIRFVICILKEANSDRIKNVKKKKKIKGENYQ